MTKAEYSYFEALENIERKKFKSTIFILFGKEEFLKTAVLAALRRSNPEFAGNYARFYSKESPWQQIVSELMTFPFFGKAKLVSVYDDGNLFKLFQKELKSYCEKPNANCVLAVQTTEKPRLELKNAVFVSCDEQRRQIAIRILGDEAKKTGKVLLPDVATLLFERSGSSVTQSALNLEKIAAYIGKRREIAAPDVELLTTDMGHFSNFELAKAIASGNSAASVKILRRLLLDGVEPQLILGALAWQFRKLTQAKVFVMSGKREFDAVVQAGVRFNHEEIITLVRNFKLERLKKITEALLKADKSLKLSIGAEDVILNAMLAEIWVAK